MPLITSSRVLLLSVLVFYSVLYPVRSQLDLDDLIFSRGSFSAEDEKEETQNSSTTAAPTEAPIIAAAAAADENETTTTTEPPPVLGFAIDGPNVRKSCPPEKALSDNKCETIVQFEDE